MSKAYMLPFSLQKDQIEWWDRSPSIYSTTAGKDDKLSEILQDMTRRNSLAIDAQIYQTIQKIESLRWQQKFKFPEILGIEVKNNPEYGKPIYDEDGKYQKPTVIVTFADGTSEKAIASEDDTFSLEQGISICYTKKLLSMLTTDSGSKVYNQILHNALKTYKTQQRKISETKRAEQLEKERLERLAAKHAKRKAKYEAKKREQEISVQAEAYARALRMVNQAENK